MPDLEDTSTLERPKSGPAAGAVPPRNPATAAPVPAPTPTATPAAPTATPSAVPSAPAAAAPVAGAMAGFDLGETIRGNMQRRERAQADLGQRAAVLERDLATLKEKAGHAPQPQQTNPVQAFGSAAMFLATMGSLMTRRPMLNALRAGAEVMEAYHKNDMAAQQQAFQTWKAETDAAMAIQRFEQQAYDNAVNRSNADLATTAAAMKDNVVLTLLQSGRRDDALSIIAGRDLSHRRLAGASVAAGVANQRHQFFVRFQAAKTPEERAQIKQEYNDWVTFNDPTAARTEATADTKDPFRQDRMDAYAELKAAREAQDEEGVRAAQKKLEDIRVGSGKGGVAAGQKTPNARGALTEGALAQANEEIARRKASGETLSPGDEGRIRNEFIAKAVLSSSPYMQGLQPIQAQAVKDAIAANPEVANDPAKIGQIVRDATGRSAATPHDVGVMEAHGTEYAQVLDTLDRMQTALNTSFTTGLGGKIARPVEAIGNILGVMPDATRAQFLSDLKTVQEALPQLLSYKGVGSSSRSNDEKIGKILRGENWGDTGINTLSSIDALRSMLREDVLDLGERYSRQAGRPLPALQRRGVTLPTAESPTASSRPGSVIRYDAQGNRIP